MVHMSNSFSPTMAVFIPLPLDNGNFIYFLVLILLLFLVCKAVSSFMLVQALRTTAIFRNYYFSNWEQPPQCSNKKVTVTVLMRGKSSLVCHGRDEASLKLKTIQI